MVDASIRLQILEIMQRLKREFKVSFLYITHDLSTAYHVSDDIMILHQGRVVEQGDARRVIDHPQHAYTQQLVDAIPIPDPDVRWAAAPEAVDAPDDSAPALPTPPALAESAPVRPLVKAD